MGIAMMKLILLSVSMTMETVAYLMLLQIIAQNAHVMFLRLVQLVFILYLAMDIAIMSQTINNVILMVETVVDLA